MAIKDLFLVEGVIEGLAVGQAPVNLLQQVQSASSSTQGLVAAAQAAAGEVGLAAGAMTVAMYDGETMDHFAFCVGDIVLQGAFPEVTFSNGDKVKVIYEKNGDAKHVLAIARPQDKTLWLPLLLDTGLGPTFLRSMRSSVSVFLMGFIGFLGVGVFVDGLLDGPTIFFAGCINLALGAVIGLWDFKDFRHRGQQATEIFRMLGFKNPVWLDLRPFSLIRLNHDLKGECIYRYDLAMNKQR